MDEQIEYNSSSANTKTGTNFSINKNSTSVE
jgi:hypothetical protein